MILNAYECNATLATANDARIVQIMHAYDRKHGHRPKMPVWAPNGMDITERVVNGLRRHGPTHCGALAQKINCDKNGVGQCLRALFHAGKVTNEMGPNRYLIWRLTDA